MIDYGNFQNGEFLLTFMDKVLPTITKKIVIITHNGDLSAPDSDREIWVKNMQERPLYRFAELLESSKNIIRWFASNCFWLNGTSAGSLSAKPTKLTCIPVGLENRMWSQTTRHIHAMTKIAKTIQPETRMPPKSHDIFFGHWRHHQRADTSKLAEHEQAVEQELLAAGWEQFAGNINGWHHWAEIVATHRFVACPWGNGLDTHRVWEVLLLGSFPVVKTSTLNSLYEDLPVLIVQRWSDVTPEMLERSYIQFTSQAASLHMEKLLMPYWLNIIRTSQHTLL
jgi:hypothetical protein